MSAGRLYDKIGDKAKATVLYVLPRGILCRVKGLSNDEKPVPDTDPFARENVEIVDEQGEMKDGGKED